MCIAAKQTARAASASVDHRQIMSTTSTYLAEEALALPSDQRAQLAQLLIDSLVGDGRTDGEIRTLLQSRLEALKDGRDAGLTFEQVFGAKP